MMHVPDPAWKRDPDIVADESAEERYAPPLFYDDPEERERELCRDNYTAQMEALGYEADGSPKEESTALIAITRLPEIKENLRGLRAKWEQKAKDAAAMVCTDDSVQSIKAMRAEMRKEFDDADRQRKAVKDRYMAAWNEVEATWKECVSEPFKRADASYKATIDEFEGEIRQKCREELEAYFAELCAAKGIDFMTLEQAMAIGRIKISLADAKSRDARKIKDALALVADSVSCGIRNIQEMEDAAEILIEYKKCFDVAHAIATVQGRKRLIAAEKENEARRKAERERQAEAVKKVEAVAPPVEVAPATEKKEKVFEEFSFTVYNCTRTQLIKIREFLKQEGIKYE